MVRESREHDDESVSDSFRFMTMLPLAVATSIDALAVGVTFAFLQVDIVPAVSFIGATTFVLSCIGVKIGMCSAQSTSPAQSCSAVSC